MPLRFIAAFTLLVSTFAAHAAAVDTLLGEWTDAARSNRVVPYKIYVPQGATAPAPVVIFSHGLGGNRDGAVYLLNHLAENGYVAVAVQHPGSDTKAVFPGGTVNQAGLRDAISPGAAADRFRDIPFAIDELTTMNANDARLKGRMDMSKVGLSGHSYGAITTLALAGQGFGPGGGFSFADDRLKAAIAYSPSKPRQGDPAQVFSGIRMPTFHMTGTRDENPLDPSEPAANRIVPYRSIANGDKYLIVFEGGDHMIFSGRSFQGGPRPQDPRFHAWIQKASLAFWDTYLRGNAEAKTYLTGGKFAAELAGEGTYEFQTR
ncbi:MAG: alpha/beta hydrolase family protein [Micropepsaceae bacterium]